MTIVIEPEGGPVAGYTFLDLQNEVLAFQFSETKYRPLVKKWLNQGVRRAALESEMRLRESIAAYTIEAAAQTLELPEDFASFTDFYDADTGARIYPTDVQDFDRLTARPGRPTHYVTIGSDLRLYPTPDATYNLDLRYRSLPADMVLDEDTPGLPVQYQELPIAYAMKKAYLRENDSQQAQVWDAEWQAGVLKMRGEVQSDMADGPRQIAGSYGTEGANVRVVGG